MIPATVDFDALEDLIDALQSAERGDRELDLKIEYCIGVTLNEHIDLAGMMIEEGFSWDHVVDAMDCKIAEYSSSLDAALEGENIVFVMWSKKRFKWGAIHRAETGVETLAWGATEALARRTAPLKALLEDERRARDAARPKKPALYPVEPSPDSGEVPGDGGEPSGDRKEESEIETAKPLQETGEWKILF